MNERKQKLYELIYANSFFKGELTDDMDFFEDLDFESLSFFSLIMDIEHHFPVYISEQDIDNGINTPKKMYDLISEKIDNV